MFSFYGRGTQQTGDAGPRKDRRRLGTLAVPMVILLGVVIGACGSSDSGSGSGAGGKDLTVGWLFYGPKEDGGWNSANFDAQEGAQELIGDSITQLNADNIPYTDEAAPVWEQFVTSQNANVLVDTGAYGEIFTDVCDKYPDVYCIQTAPFTKLGKNTTGWWPKSWFIEYTAGVAAGLSTKTDSVGYVLAYDVPFIIGQANAFTMGCRSVNSECEVRKVVTNDYYNPPKTTQAVSTLLDANADVIRTFTNDGEAYCGVLKERGNALSIGQFSSNGEQCGDAALVSTVWDFTDYYTREFESIQNGNFVSKQIEYLDPETTFSLEDWGPNVSEDVKDRVQQTLDDLASGSENPFVGPIKDSSGKVRVAPGEVLSDDFLYGEWKWDVEGIRAG